MILTKFKKFNRIGDLTSTAGLISMDKCDVRYILFQIDPQNNLVDGRDSTLWINLQIPTQTKLTMFLFLLFCDDANKKEFWRFTEDDVFEPAGIHLDWNAATPCCNAKFLDLIVILRIDQQEHTRSYELLSSFLFESRRICNIRATVRKNRDLVYQTKTCRSLVQLTKRSSSFIITSIRKRPSGT